jgi:hypothetical protein
VTFGRVFFEKATGKQAIQLLSFLARESFLASSIFFFSRKKQCAAQA